VLLSLAEQRFDPVSEGERRVLCAASTGERVSCGPASTDLNAPENDPARAGSWGQDRTIRAAFLQWLCLEPTVREQIHPFGIHVIAARIEGNFDIAFATIPFPMFFLACWWPGGIVLRNASLPELGLTKCWIGPLSRLAGEDASHFPVIHARGL